MTEYIHLEGIDMTGELNSLSLSLSSERGALGVDFLNLFIHRRLIFRFTSAPSCFITPCVLICIVLMCHLYLSTGLRYFTK
jgi:hypothetical protein